MNSEVQFYICPRCFRITETDELHHKLSMLYFPGYPPGHELLKPPRDKYGNMISRAPRWFVEGQAILFRR